MIGSKDKSPRTMGRKAAGKTQKSGLVRLIARTPLAPVIAAMFAAVAAVLVMATPAWLLESWVSAFGLPALFPPAAPPLGNTARALLALLAALGTGIGLFILLFAATMFARKARPPKPMMRTRPVAPAAAAEPSHDARRAPIFAENELGSPFMSDEAREAGETLTMNPTETDSDGDDDALLLEQALPPFAAPEAARAPSTADEDLIAANRLARIMADRDMDDASASPGFDDVFAVPEYAVPEPEGMAAHQDGIETPAYHDMAIPADPVELSTGEQARATLDALVQRLEFGVARRGHEGRPLRPPFAADVRLAQLAGGEKRATA